MRKGTASKGPTQRQLRVGEEIRHILSQALARGEFHEGLLTKTTVSITQVQISPDLRHAKVLICAFGDQQEEELLAKELNEHAGPLRTQLARSLTTKYVPRLFFHVDTSFKEAFKINALLNSEKVARDLKAAQEEAENDHDKELS